MTTATPFILPIDQEKEKVYDNLKAWLLQPAETRVRSYSKNQAASNGVRQLLFERENKAIKKYGESLGLNEPPKTPAFVRAAEKLADAAFFLYHAFHHGDGRADEQFVLVQNLHTLLNSLLSAYRNKAPPPSLSKPDLSRH